jgi:hypothetical protein
MFDAVTLAAAADELNEKILHGSKIPRSPAGRVQEIVQLDTLSFGFEMYAQHARQYLFVTADANDACVHLVSQKLRGSGETPSSFLLFARKRDALAQSLPDVKEVERLKTSGSCFWHTLIKSSPDEVPCRLKQKQPSLRFR